MALRAATMGLGAQAHVSRSSSRRSRRASRWMARSSTWTEFGAQHRLCATRPRRGRLNRHRTDPDRSDTELRPPARMVVAAKRGFVGAQAGDHREKRRQAPLRVLVWGGQMGHGCALGGRAGDDCGRYQMEPVGIGLLRLPGPTVCRKSRKMGQFGRQRSPWLNPSPTRPLANARLPLYEGCWPRSS